MEPFEFLGSRYKGSFHTRLGCKLISYPTTITIRYKTYSPIKHKRVVLMVRREIIDNPRLHFPPISYI